MVDDIPWVSIGLLARVRPCFSGHVWRVLDFFKCHKCLGDYRCYRTGNPHVFTEQSWTIHRSLRILPVTNPLILPLFEHLPSLRLVVQQKRSTMLQEDNRLRQSSDARNSVQKQSFLCYPIHVMQFQPGCWFHMQLSILCDSNFIDMFVALRVERCYHQPDQPRWQSWAVSKGPN